MQLIGLSFAFFIDEEGDYVWVSGEREMEAVLCAPRPNGLLKFFLSCMPHSYLCIEVFIFWLSIFGYSFCIFCTVIITKICIVIIAFLIYLILHGDNLLFAHLFSLYSSVHFKLFVGHSEFKYRYLGNYNLYPYLKFYTIW